MSQRSLQPPRSPQPPSPSSAMIGETLPRSIRWRMQLGLLTYPTRTTWTMEALNDANHEVLIIQREAYHDLRQMYSDLDADQNQEQLHNNGGSEEEHEETGEMNTDEVDPLTMMVMDMEKKEKRLQELELKYKKERALRKRGVSVEKHIEDDSSDGDRFDTYSSIQTLGVIEKDLNRLPPDHHMYHHSRKNYHSQGTEISFDDSKRERTKVLTEILHIYAREHPHIGYRQGMHEIASYFLLILEMDVFDQESALEQHFTGGLLDANYIATDAYHMLKCILSSLQGAYDVKQHANDSSPMEAMAKAILAKVKDTACDKVLYEHVSHMQCPPELYCTRWVRLMFSREVEGWRNVLLLWDVIMDLISLDGTIKSMPLAKYTKIGVTPKLVPGKFPLMEVLEASAASMILLQRSKLLNAADPNESIHTLMNVPPLTDIFPLTSTLLSMMRRIQLKETIRQISPTPVKTSIFQSAQNAIRDMGGPGSGDDLRRSLKAEMAVAQKLDIPSVPALDDAWTGLTILTRTSSKTLAATFRPLSLSRRALDDDDDENDTLLSRSEMATTLHQGVTTIKKFLSATSKSVPQGVWDALCEIEQVRHDLLAETNGKNGK